LTVLSADDLASLIAAVAARQDRVAFTTLFDYFAPRIKAYLMRLGASPGNADEMTQDVMLVLWRKATLFDPARSSLRTWLYRVARNRRIDMVRRERVDFLDPSVFALDVVDQSIGDADQGIDMRDREQALRRALLALPEDQAALVRLAFFESLSHSEIAERTQIPLGTVKSRIRLAFARLRRQLEADGVREAV
jgi:RNA polymerase sigma-70 factor (ECF subfamily)